MTQQFTIDEKGKKFGILHPSGLNHSQRRQKIAIERHRPYREKIKKQKEAHDNAKKAIAERVKRQQSAAHIRAIKRKEK